MMVIISQFEINTLLSLDSVSETGQNYNILTDKIHEDYFEK